MSEPDDKPLHNWVRQSLDTYRPAYGPTDWVRMQRILRRRRRWRMGALVGAGLLLVSCAGWLLYTTVDEPTNTSRSQTIANVSAAPKPLRGDSGAVQSRLIVTSEAGKTGVFTTKVSAADKLLPTKQRLVPTPAPLLPIRALLPVQTALKSQIRLPETVVFSAEERPIIHQMLTGAFGTDSTSYRTLERNRHNWPDAVIVCDLTTSMYPYTTQLFSWFDRNAQHQTTKGMVFFTDCDSLGRQTRPGGPAGRMYVTKSWNKTQALPILLEAARNTVRNHDDAENDIEALLVAQRQFPEAKHLILIADNLSHVKDTALLANVSKPVHVILCGTTGSDTASAFQPEFYTIARQTNGSLHTLEDDLLPSTVSSNTIIRVGKRYYRYSTRRKQFKLTPFDHRPKRYLKFIWL